MAASMSKAAFEKVCESLQVTTRCSVLSALCRRTPMATRRLAARHCTLQGGSAQHLEHKDLSDSAVGV